MQSNTSTAGSASPNAGNSNPTNTESTSGGNTSLEALEGFALLCKNSSGLQVVMVLKQVLKHQQIFVFGELFDIPSIQALEHSEHKPWFDLLKVFAYGTFDEYRLGVSQGKLPELAANGPELTKLKQLTIVNMASTQKTLPYSLLQSSLSLPNLRALEDLIIECIYLGLIDGRLNQKDARLDVTSAMGRDLAPNDLNQMIQTLDNWLSSTDDVLLTLNKEMSRVSAEEEEQRKIESEIDEKRKVTIEEIKLNQKNNSAGGEDGVASTASNAASSSKKAQKFKGGIGGIFGRGRK